MSEVATVATIATFLVMRWPGVAKVAVVAGGAATTATFATWARSVAEVASVAGVWALIARPSPSSDSAVFASNHIASTPHDAPSLGPCSPAHQRARIQSDQPPMFLEDAE